jgi:glycosyltransferase involved in cell wall biosynthesis
MTQAHRPARILVLNERDPMHPRSGGAEIHVTEIFGRIARRGHEVIHLAAGFEGGAAVERVDDIEVRRLGGLARYYPRAVLETRRLTRRGEIDVVVECLNKVPFFSPAYSAKPVLALCHHLFGEVAFQQVPWPIAAGVWSLERGIPTVYRRCPFIAISESSRDDLVRRGIPAARVSVSHPGIHRPSFAVDTRAPRAGKVIFVGRLEAYKKVDVMLRAMHQLAPRFPDTEIVVIGRGPEADPLKELARSLGLGERTRFTGFISDLERDRLLSEARVCVFPSEKEGWGLTVIEANATGTPVVATDADGLRDSVRDGETGFLVGDEDVAGFARRIAELLEDDALAVRMSAAALEWSKRFDWEAATDDMLAGLECARAGAAAHAAHTRAAQ